jgi:molybdopterin-guanine dinucleotide biosynthesis protein A
MGTDKSFVPLHGKPLIAHLLARVAALGQDETILITNRPDDYAHLGLAMFTDVLPGKGALGGIYTAIHASQSPYALVLACDMPFVNADLLRYMLGLTEGSEVDVVVPRVEDHPQGLHAIYSQACLSAIRARLEADRLKVIGFYDDVRVRYLDPPEWSRLDPQGLSFHNINTPAELLKAQHVADADQSGGGTE